MRKYLVEISPKATRDIRSLTDSVQERVFAAIYRLADDPRPHGYIKMKGRPTYRIRVGDYRVVYDIFDKIVTVEIVEVGHRRDVYR